jgi:hypothetical protein
LSLNDCYWVVEEGFEGTFSKYNLYDNRFSQILALIAITGYGKSIRSSLDSCPEFTTNGMLPKCWRRENGKILLYKGGTTGGPNTGNEPYSEFYAAQIAKIMGINAIDYKLSKWKATLLTHFSSSLSSPLQRLVFSHNFALRTVPGQFREVSFGSSFLSLCPLFPIYKIPSTFLVQPGQCGGSLKN